MTESNSAKTAKGCCRGRTLARLDVRIDPCTFLSTDVEGPTLIMAPLDDHLQLFCIPDAINSERPSCAKSSTLSHRPSPQAPCSHWSLAVRSISETSWAAEPLTDGGCTDCNGGCNPCGGVCETGSDCTNNCTCESDPHYYVCCLPPPLVCDPAEELEESFCEPGS